MSNNFNNYIDKKSYIHSINPTVKFIIIIFLIIFVFISTGLLTEIILVGIVLVLWFSARMNWKATKALLVSILAMFVFLLLINWFSFKSPGLSVFSDKTASVFGISMDNFGRLSYAVDGNQNDSAWYYFSGNIWGSKVGELIDIAGKNAKYTDVSNIAIGQIKMLGYTKYILTNNNGKTDWYMLPYKSEWYAFSTTMLYYSLNVTMKIMLMVSVVTILVSTTTNTQLTNAITNVLLPLKIFKAPVAEWSMTISLAIRFVPSLLEEAQKILNAQASRGVDFGNGNIKEKGKALVSLIIPMFSIAFIKSNELANAMEVRGYNARYRRTQYRELKVKWTDLFFLLVCGIIFGLLIIYFAQHIYLGVFAYSDLLLTRGA